MCGYLEFCKEQPELSKAPLLKHLHLLMEHARTYSWSSVRNFHLSLNNAIEQGGLSWQSYESIHERAQTFFTHQDLRSNFVTSSRNGSFPARDGKAKISSAKNGTTPVNAVVPFLVQDTKKSIAVGFVTLQTTPCLRAPSANSQFLHHSQPPRQLRPPLALISPPDYVLSLSCRTRLERLACPISWALSV